MNRIVITPVFRGAGVDVVESWEAKVFSPEPDLYGGIIWYEAETHPIATIAEVAQVLEQLAFGDTPEERRAEG